MNRDNMISGVITGIYWIAISKKEGTSKKIHSENRLASIILGKATVSPATASLQLTRIS